MAKDTGEHSPFRRPAFLVSAGFLAAVIIMATVVIGFGDSDEPATRPPTPTTPATPAEAGARCQPTDTDQKVPSTTPAGIRWSLFQTVALPYSPTAGPLVTEGGVARCYAHTPLGALLASWNISTRFAVAQDWKKVTEVQVVPGPGRAAYIKARSSITAPVTGGGLSQIVGFRFLTYTPQTAVIQIVSRNPSGTMGLFALTVMWDRGDWRLSVQPDGSPSPPEQTVTSLDGYVPWSGL